MPEPQPEKRRPDFPPPSPPPRRGGDAEGPVPYAELVCQTNYSFLEGASYPDELVNRAVELGLSALAITDDHSLAGVVKAHTAAKAVGLKLLIGSLVELQGSETLEAEPPWHSRAVLYAQHRQGYGRLSRLLTRGRMAAPKGECRLTWSDVAEHADGLLAIVHLRPGDAPDQTEELRKWKEVFGDRLYATGMLSRRPYDEWLLRRWERQTRAAGVPLVASNHVLYHEPGRRYLQDVVTAIRLGKTVADLGADRQCNGERHLKSGREMLALWQPCPEAVARTVEVARRCTFSLDELCYDYPVELCPPDKTPFSFLKELAAEGAKSRYPQGTPEKVENQIRHELRLIEDLRYEAYFLTVWDLVRFARSREILCQGRGSAANSAVCYCLGVTSVDPAFIDLLFERFLSRERNEPPDIDIDFEHERREEVIQYVYEKYGRERAGMTAEVITYRPRSAVRDVGKALGLSLDRVDALAKSVDHVDGHEQLAGRFREAGFDPGSRIGRQCLLLVQQLLGFPRHLSQHVGGMVLTNTPLCEIVPIENASMPGRTVLQWDKDDLDALSILKVDCLALGMLTAIRRAFDLIEAQTGSSYSLASVPAEDSAVYEMIQRADTVGVFQIESRAQMSMLPRLKPREFYDLVVEVAIVRPGPIQGDMVHPYLRRRMGQEEVEYPKAGKQKEELEKVLGRTLGVPLFQEQAMRLVIVAAGFSPDEADQLRRAMAAWRKTGVIEKFRQKLIDGMVHRGYELDFAERLYKQICGFGEYGFPESHAASFALLVYCSAWIKRHHPAAFLAALINSQPMGFYSVSSLVRDARQHGVEVRPVDVLSSAWDCTLERTGEETPAVRLGLRVVKGLSEAAVGALVEARASAPFVSFADFARRSGLSSKGLSALARAHAFRSLSRSRRDAVWESLEGRETAPLFDGHVSDGRAEATPEVTLPSMTARQEMLADYQTTGLSLAAHPLTFLRDELAKKGVLPTTALPGLADGERCSIAGLVLCRQRPGSAGGITFITMEDEQGTANLIVRLKVWERLHRVVRHAIGMIASGVVQNHDGVIHLLVDSMEDLSGPLNGIDPKPRDFR